MFYSGFFDIKKQRQSRWLKKKNMYFRDIHELDLNWRVAENRGSLRD